MRDLRLAASILLLIFSAGCASSGGGTVKREMSEPTKPKWIDTIVNDPTRLYYVGGSVGATTKEDGIESATNQAIAKAASYIGVKISSQFDETTTQSSTDISNKTSAKSAASIVGAKVEKIYWEKVTREQGNFSISKFDVYVQVSLDKSFAEKERARQAEEKKNKAGLALKLFNKSAEKVKQRDYIGAKSALITAKKNLESFDEDVSVPGGTDIKSSKELLEAVKGKINSVTELLRRVSLSVKTNFGDEGNSAFSANFSEQLTKHGYSVSTPEQSQIRIQATARVNRKSGAPLGMHAYAATGDATGINTTNQAVVHSMAFDVKGFNTDDHMAAINALSEAGEKAGEQFAAELSKKESELLGQ
ncbi:MAG: hypothetical protein HY280_06575 [Nitrospinae bacterium]|nr:hypothetical protein [Nitrospinota bacterium]